MFTVAMAGVAADTCAVLVGGTATRVFDFSQAMPQNVNGTAPTNIHFRHANMFDVPYT